MQQEDTIECPGCNMDISINETQCPECGYEIEDEDREDSE